jgi:hypothetical protein
MKYVSKRDLERTQTGTTDQPHAAATGSGHMADEATPTGAADHPGPADAGTAAERRRERTPEEHAADAWTGQYPDRGRA